MKRSLGFTLIELMIVVAIIGFLMIIAIPSYNEYAYRSKRTDAHSALLDLASRQERYIAQNNSYTSVLTAGGLNFGTTTSQDGYYNLSAAACDGDSLTTCYKLTASATGGQAGDVKCKDITYDSTGAKSGTTPGECW